MYNDRNSNLGALALAVMLMFTVSSFALYSTRAAAADIRVILAGEQEVMNGNTYSVPTGAKLTEAQYASYQAGNLYVNVHTKAYPEGEIRGQLNP
jgi:CHRD domain